MCYLFKCWMYCFGGLTHSMKWTLLFGGNKTGMRQKQGCREGMWNTEQELLSSYLGRGDSFSTGLHSVGGHACCHSTTKQSRAHTVQKFCTQWSWGSGLGDKLWDWRLRNSSLVLGHERKAKDVLQVVTTRPQLWGLAELKKHTHHMDPETGTVAG